MKPLPPFQVIYQTAEDGLGDTVKPRLIEAEADLDRVLVIDEAKRELTLSDERIEKAITQNGARLIILDPIQAYMGEKTDMNRANEVRPMFRRLADVAERTGCAVILIGHLNKAAGGQSAYRGLGSIDFRAAARSVLLIGRVKREPNVRVIVHDKSSLAPEGKPVAFCLDPETGFSWIGEYDITADELLSGAGGNTATKTEQAEKLILDLLADGKELASEDIDKAAAEAGISARTVRAAKKMLIGQSSTEGERKRRARLALQEQKALPKAGADKCPPYQADICPPEIEKEIEIEKERDRELDTGQPARAAYGRYENVFRKERGAKELRIDENF